MKAFSFRLEQVLRWRGMQVSLQKARVAEAAARTSQLRAALDSRQAEVATGAVQIVREPTGLTLGAYAAFVEKSRARMRELEEQLVAALSIMCVRPPTPAAACSALGRKPCYTASRDSLTEASPDTALSFSIQPAMATVPPQTAV